MKLVDLDQQIFVPITDETKGGATYEIQTTVCEFFKGCCDEFTPEVVDAIPVKWIFEQMQILHELHNKNEYVLQWLIEMWQKEQEAQNG